MKRSAPGLIRCGVLLLAWAAGACVAVPGGRAIADPGHAGADAPPTLTERDRASVAFWRERAGKDPQSVLAQSSLATALLRVGRATGAHGDLSEAGEAFERWLELDPASGSAPIGLAYSLIGRHKFAEAVDWARTAVERNSGGAEARALLGDALLAFGEVEEALKISEEQAAAAMTLETLSRLALARQAAGDGRAIGTMREAMEAGRLLEAPRRSLAWCGSILGDMLMERGKVEEARGEYETAVDLDSECLHARWRLAQVQLQRGRAGVACASMELVVGLCERPAYLLTLADAVEAAGHTGAAERAAGMRRRAETAMVSEVERGELGHARELVEFWLSGPEPDRGDPTAAAELAVRELREVRHDAGAFSLASWAMFRSGRVEEGAVLAAEAVRRGPGDARVLCRGGIVLCAAGKREAGVGLINRALELNPMLEEPLVKRAREAMAGPGKETGR